MDIQTPKKKISFILLLIGIGIATGYFIIKEYSWNTMVEAVTDANPWWLLPSLLSGGIYFLCEGTNIGQVLKLLGHSVTLKEKIKYAFAGFFFSSITPSSTGGQPAQIYYMHKDHVPVAHSSLTLLIGLLAFQIASVTIGALGLIYSLCSKSMNLGRFITIFLLGFFLNLLFLAILALGVFFEKFSKWMMGLILKGSEKTIYRDRPKKLEKIKKKMLKTLGEYRRAAKLVGNHPSIMVKLISISFVELIALHSIVFFVYKALGGGPFKMWQIFSMEGMLYVAASAAPVPGSSGFTEGGFSLVFQQIFNPKLMGAAIVLSRLLNFIIPLIVSGIGLLFLSKNRTSKKEV